MSLGHVTWSMRDMNEGEPALKEIERSCLSSYAEMGPGGRWSRRFLHIIIH